MRLRSILAALVLGGGRARNGGCGGSSRLRRCRQGGGRPAAGVPAGGHDESSRQRAPCGRLLQGDLRPRGHRKPDLRSRQRPREHPGAPCRQRDVPAAAPAQPPRRRPGGRGALDRAALRRRHSGRLRLGPRRDGHEGHGHLPARDDAALEAIRRAARPGRPLPRDGRRGGGQGQRRRRHGRPVQTRPARRRVLPHRGQHDLGGGRADGGLGRRRHREGAVVAQDRRDRQGRTRLDPRTRRGGGAPDPRPRPHPRLRAARAADPGRRRVFPAARARHEGRARARFREPPRGPRRPRSAQAPAVRRGAQRLHADDDLGDRPDGQREDQRHPGRGHGVARLPAPARRGPSPVPRDAAGSCRRPDAALGRGALRDRHGVADRHGALPRHRARPHALLPGRAGPHASADFLDRRLAPAADGQSSSTASSPSASRRTTTAATATTSGSRSRTSGSGWKSPTRSSSTSRGRRRGASRDSPAGASSSSRPAGPAARSRSRPAFPSAVRARCSRRGGSSSPRR